MHLKALRMVKSIMELFETLEVLLPEREVEAIIIEIDLVEESCLIPCMPDNVDEVNQSSSDDNLALGRPSTITQFPYVFFRREIKSHVKSVC